MRTPRILTFFVTDRCNAKCAFCCLFEERDASSHHELRPEEVERMATHMDPLELLMLTGGEPTLRTDLVDLARPLAARCKQVALLTNGAFPERTVDVSEGLLGVHDRLRLTVNVSIDAWGAEHDRIRRLPGLFASLRETLDALRDVSARHKGRVGRSVAIVYSEQTASSVGGTLDRVIEELAPDAISVTLERGDEPRPTTPVTDLDGYLEVAKRAAKYSVAAHLGRTRVPIVGPAVLARAGAVLAAAKPRALVRAVRRDTPFGPCEAGRVIGVLRPDGAVTACELLPGALGNVRDADYDFRAVWSSMQAGDVRRHIRETKCRCTHECYVNPTLAIHPLSLARALFGPVGERRSPARVAPRPLKD